MARGRRALLAQLGASRVLLLLAQMGAGLPGTPPLLRLRGGGGVFEGQLSEAHGLGRVSETLMMRERLGANCGDVANVPPDITSHHHLDSLAPQSLFESLGTEAALTPSGELTTEWEEQGRNFVKAHVSRGAAMMADMAGASLHLTRALHAKFDADGDGFMQREDMEALLAATEPKAYEADLECSGGAEKITAEVWQQILNDTNSDAGAGLAVDGLFWLYSRPGEDVRRDCWTVFGTEGMAGIPHYNPLFDIFPDPNMFRAASPDDAPVPAAATSPPHASGGSAGPGPPKHDSGAQLRNWVLEEGNLPADHDVWDDKALEELAPGADEGGDAGGSKDPLPCWHQQDWSAVDLRLLRQFLLETSLKADCKQRPVQTEPASPPIMSTEGILLNRPAGPVEAFGLTWNEWMGCCKLPAHAGLGGRPFHGAAAAQGAGIDGSGGERAGGDRGVSYTHNDARRRAWAVWQGQPSVVTWARFGSAAGAHADKPQQPQTEEEREMELEAAMREDATALLRRVAAKMGAENAEELSFEELRPRLSDDGDVILPSWLCWEDLQEMSGVGQVFAEKRDALAALFSRSFNSGDRHVNMTVAAARAAADPFAPVRYNWDGQPWVYDRPQGARPLGLSQRQDPWNASSASLAAVVERHQQMLGGGLERVVASGDRRVSVMFLAVSVMLLRARGLTGARGDRRKSFKLLMVGPDGAGKSSLLFCWKVNQALDDANAETVPTACAFNLYLCLCICDANDDGNAETVPTACAVNLSVYR